MDPVTVGVRSTGTQKAPQKQSASAQAALAAAAPVAPVVQPAVAAAPVAPVAEPAPVSPAADPVAPVAASEASGGLMKKAVVVAAVVVAIAGVGGSALLYHKYQLAQAKLKSLADPQAAAKVEADTLVKKVSNLIQLPNNETPTVATVVDASKLKDQSFFADAQNGDKVLIYTANAKEAILYRPSTNKIIQVAPVNLQNNQASAGQTAPAATTPAKK